MARNTSYRAMQ